MKKKEVCPPSLSIVVPSFNQAEFLERTLKSIIEQKYEALELIVIDGGSVDGSTDIIRAYEEHISFWASEPDKGQASAINKGLMRATGEWVGWQNSDDIYLPGAFQQLSEQIEKHPGVGFVTANLALITETDSLIREIHYVKPTYNALRAEGMVVANQAAFWCRSIHKEIGFLDARFRCSFDYDWFLRLTKHCKAIHVQQIWGALRLHGATKSTNLNNVFAEENRKILMGRELSRWKIWIYQLRRLFFLVAKGDIRYVMQGIRKRLLQA